ncbi:MAG: hypothetical protein MUD17_10785 [Gemmatimonadaceae bacterium]|nr:hypothetical protein [Gemmatimonadaceae bacterium]
MADEPFGAAIAHVVGLHRGREINAHLRLRLEEAGLAFADESRGHRFRVPFDVIDGWQDTPGHIALYLRDGDVLDIATADDATRALVRAVRDAAVRPPEFTRSLRALGAVDATEQATHDRWFGPLLRARRAIEGVTDPLRQAALLDADLLRAELVRTLAELAAQRTGGAGPAARALEAMLEEESAPVHEALTVASPTGASGSTPCVSSSAPPTTPGPASPASSDPAAESRRFARRADLRRA